MAIAKLSWKLRRPVDIRQYYTGHQQKTEVVPQGLDRRYSVTLKGHMRDLTGDGVSVAIGEGEEEILERLINRES